MRYIGSISKTMSGETQRTVFGNINQNAAEAIMQSAKTFLTDLNLSDNIPQSGGAIILIVVKAAFIEPISSALKPYSCKNTVVNELDAIAAQYRNSIELKRR